MKTPRKPPKSRKARTSSVELLKKWIATCKAVHSDIGVHQPNDEGYSQLVYEYFDPVAGPFPDRGREPVFIVDFQEKDYFIFLPNGLGYASYDLHIPKEESEFYMRNKLRVIGNEYTWGEFLKIIIKYVEDSYPKIPPIPK